MCWKRNSRRAVIAWLTPLVDSARVPVLIVDDSLYVRQHSRKVALLAKIYDQVEHVAGLVGWEHLYARRLFALYLAAAP